MKIEMNTVPSVTYTLTVEGQKIESTDKENPLVFLFGAGQMIPGFEEELMGATQGERREFTLEPERAYGSRDEDAVLEIPRENFSQLEAMGGPPLEAGMTLVAQMPHGPAQFTVVALTDETVTADFNPPMAGKSRTFSVEVVELREASEEEVAHGHAHGPGGVEH